MGGSRDIWTGDLADDVWQLPDEFKKLIKTCMAKVALSINRNDPEPDVRYGDVRTVSFFACIELFVTLVRRATGLDMLDRHKLLGIVTVASVMCKPLNLSGRVGERYSEKAHYANEILAHVVCTELLFCFMKNSFDKEHKNHSVCLQNLYGFPKNIRDTDKVSECYINMLSYIELDMPSEGAAELKKNVLSIILGVAHIYFYLETYNRLKWTEAIL